ncbi:hypothetical protein [Nocardia sp. NPDC049149]|uniref:hypothetical protein n=1 Tax=Nocardia sp. NPDC049149 TaxID=3364315 RepID=UPI00371EFD87
MTSPLRERTLLLAARDVLSKTAIIEPVLNDYRADTGVTHPLETALGDLQAAVDAYAEVG